MIKKLLLIGAGVGLLAVVLFGRNAASFVGTAYEEASKTVRDTVPTEWQIKTARRMVKELEPEIRRCMHVIAKEEVEVNRIGEQIDEVEVKNTKDKSDLLRLQADLGTGASHFQYAGQHYTANEVKQDLGRRFERFKTSEATLNSLRDMREARERNLEAARKKLESMVAAQRQLQVEVENLEASLKLCEVAEASSDFNFDNSKLARTKELIAQIRTDLEVSAKLANADINFHGEIPLDEPASDDIERQVAEYFGIDGPATATVASIRSTED